MLDTQLSLNQNFGWTKRQSKERRKSRKIIITIINRSIQLREWEETMMDNINLTLVLSRLNLWSMVKIIFFTWEIADLKYKIYIFYNYLKLNHLEFICYLTKRTVVFIIQVLSFFTFSSYGKLQASSFKTEFWEYRRVWIGNYECSKPHNAGDLRSCWYWRSGEKKWTFFVNMITWSVINHK
jgi:hypothetical protein